MDIINQVVSYFQGIVNDSTTIKMFKVGEYEDSNDSFQAYPILYLRTPFNISFDTEKRIALFRVTLSLYTNLSFDEYSNSIPTTEFYYANELNQLNDCVNNLQAIISRIEHESHNVGWTLIDPNNVVLETVTRVTNDDVNGVECTLTFRLPACINYPSYFKNYSKNG